MSKWIEWGGNTSICPVPDGHDYLIRLRSLGGSGFKGDRELNSWSWQGDPDDIVAYKILDPKVSEGPLIKSDGSTASYYELPEGATELQHLISYRNLNAQDGEMFRAIYRKGRASHSDELRDAKKVLFYAQAEVERLEGLK